MALSKETIVHVAKLARLELSEKEMDEMSIQLSEILAWIEQLGEVDVDGLEPMTSVVQMDLKVREDVVTESDQDEAIVSNAPERSDTYFVVPKVID
ncbi:uncharacterized protein METZ01_LOCUS255262 [marine metagenome]|uniref:Aspartyl/glutamyl-tRNA(Asn/Gln) amidotransferase subunit C n=1 Tax=marine metagenome TaxID=408172 RepID=A0A382IS82_9ZZZZ